MASHKDKDEDCVVTDRVCDARMKSMENWMKAVAASSALSAAISIIGWLVYFILRH